MPLSGIPIQGSRLGLLRQDSQMQQIFPWARYAICPPLILLLSEDLERYLAIWVFDQDLNREDSMGALINLHNEKSCLRRNESSAIEAVGHLIHSDTPIPEHSAPLQMPNAFHLECCSRNFNHVTYRNVLL